MENDENKSPTKSEGSFLSPRHFPISSVMSPKTPLERKGKGLTGITPTQSAFQTPKTTFGLLSEFSSSHGGTPMRQRSDIRGESRLRQVPLSIEKEGSEMTMTQDSLESKLVIWGTDVVLNECKASLKTFVVSFLPPPVETGNIYDINKPLYIQKLEEIEIHKKPFLVVDAMHIKQFDPDLYHQMVSYPQEVIPAFDGVVNDIFFERNQGISLDHQIQVRLMNVDRTKNMRYLNPEDVDQLINICGMVIRSSNIVPEMHEAFYQCYICQNTTTSSINCGRIEEPALCSNCNCPHTMQLLPNRSLYSDKQIIKIQESPEEMPSGQTPYNVLLYAHSDLVDCVQAGDRVIVTGIYRAIPIKVNPRQRVVRAVYRTFIDVIHFCKIDKSKLHGSEQESKTIFTPQRIDQINELSRYPNVYTRLANALAPGIYGNTDIKKGVLLQVFSGTQKHFTSCGRTHFRKEINILLCGDPGTSKSQILKHIHELLPRGQYTSGKGSSAVGLTAYITRDPDTRQLVLQTGALVMSDNGICCIDEFDKMTESTRSVLHEVMEQQTLSIAKAGIICQLNARTSILAAANPIKSKWDTKLTTVANIQLPHTLLSRFDLIFLMLDHQSETFDRQLALHLVSMYQDKIDNDSEFYQIDLALLKDYIAYARENIHPQLTEESAERLVQCYLEMRRIGQQFGSISAYPRQLESLIRLSEAHAKVRLSPYVEEGDVMEAIRLHKEALMQSSTDPRTGRIDINILASGFSESDRKMQADLAKAVRTHLEAVSKTTTRHQYNQLLEAIRKISSMPISIPLFDSSLKSLVDDHIITISDSKMIKFII